jgi:hypothetical protein
VPSVPGTAAPSPLQQASQQGNAKRTGRAKSDLVADDPQADEDSTPSGKQKRNIMKANFEDMKREATQLADLAKALQEELNKSNENILSLDVIEKADKIEKLARKIKGTARGL